MADFNKPVVADAHTAYAAAIVALAADLAKGLDPANASPTNLPTNSIRWNSANGFWELFDGTT